MNIRQLRKLVLETINEKRLKPRKTKNRKSELNKILNEADALLNEKSAKYKKFKNYNSNIKKDVAVMEQELSDAIKAGPEATVKWLEANADEEKYGVKAALGRFLRQGDEDGNTDDEKISVASEAKPTGELVPTQKEISFAKSVGWPLSNIKTLKNAKSGDITGAKPPKTIVAADELVLDGHHRWSSTLITAGPDAKINTTNLKLPGSPGEKLAISQVAVKGSLPLDSKGVPYATAGENDNILGASKEKLKQMIIDSRGAPQTDRHNDATELLGDDYLLALLTTENAIAKELFDIDPAEESDLNDPELREVLFMETVEKIAEKMSSNWAQANSFAAGAPERRYMPQFDGGETHKDDKEELKNVIPNLKKGLINFKTPMQAESVHKRDKLSEHKRQLNRWNKLAGLLKD